MTFKKNEIEFESDKVKVYVQQLQAENALLRQANEEKNELLIKLGYPTKATAKRKVLCLQQQFDKLKTENDNIKETFDDLFKVQYKLADTNKKLRQCLTEIKEIAEFYNNSNMDDICYQDGIYEILQKISECEGNDE